jgi:hypothetical protein
MRRRGVLSLVLLTVVTLVLSASGAADFAFPLQANSVRFAAIGDMGTGTQPQIDVAKQMVKSRAAFPFEFVIALGDNTYFTEGASGSLRSGNLAPSAITAKGFDADRSFMMIEIAGDDLYFQTTSRTGVAVDSGVIHRTIRPPL